MRICSVVCCFMDYIYCDRCVVYEFYKVENFNKDGRLSQAARLQCQKVLMAERFPPGITCLYEYNEIRQQMYA